ncbi:MAG: protein kinase [Roseburia sp.]|nr:protein kinase [Roseburia sp.]
MRCETDTPRKERYRIEEKILFGKYRIITVLGTGSSSTVYLARHLKLEVYRAIKCIPKSTAPCSNAADKSSVSFSGSLLAEANLLKTLNHPGIPLIYDIDEDNDFVYMVEEFIQGDSLEDFILHQKNISQELMIEYGIQLCGILDYLHHLSPYPILYQDLKPEHIILCGNQIKLVDFGIASFITGSGKIIQTYGTDGFAAPEACLGRAVGTASDIYSLGKVLLFMADALDTPCSPELFHVIQKACAASETKRYQTAADLKNALLEAGKSLSAQRNATDTACQSTSHLITKIAVLGSRPGAGATHFAVSLVSTLNRRKKRSVYLSMDHSDSVAAMTEGSLFWKEREGIFRYKDFAGLPSYGDGIENPLPEDAIWVRDYGTCTEEFLQQEDNELVFLVMSGSLWDIPAALTLAKTLASQKKLIFVCNYDNKIAAKKYARQLKNRVYCFPFDRNPFHAGGRKERLILQIIQREEVHLHFRHWWKRDKNTSDRRHYGLLPRLRRDSLSHRTGKFMRL